MVIMFPERWSDKEKRLFKKVIRNAYSKLVVRSCDYDCAGCEIYQLCRDISILACCVTNKLDTKRGEKE